MSATPPGIPLERRLVLGAAGALFAVWLVANFGRITADQNGVIRFVLGTLFALLILLRPKPPVLGAAAVLPRWFAPLAGVLGAVLVGGAIIFKMHQIEWLGILLLIMGCLLWALPPRFARDVFLALLLVYWVHPLPGLVFGPLELGMQRLSAWGTERVLHCINFPAWADGLTLRTGFRNFLVPEECSGMKTAVTVLLCSIGIGFLLRFAWWEVVGLVALGLVQALALNIVRMFLMVKLGADMPLEWATNFLHDTLAIFLLIAIVAIHLEASAWRKWRSHYVARRQALADGTAEPVDRASKVPKFWVIVFQWTGAVVAVLLIAAVVAGAVYKSRPRHRATMLTAVLEGLIATDLEAAERAANITLRLTPQDSALALKRVSILLQRKKYAEALADIAKVPAEKRGIELRLAEAQALLGEGKTPEAVQAVDALPPQFKDWPEVAMLMAEFAAHTKQPEAVSRNLLKAAKAAHLLPRVRALFPYLASRHDWDTIRRVDAPAPYAEPIYAVIVFSANLRMNDLAGAADALRRGLKAWPHDPLFTNPMLTMAVLRQGGEWETLFAQSFMANLQWPDADDLTRVMEASFALHRPDLAWLAYQRLAAIDPSDPALFLAPARFSEAWFTFRRQELGLKSMSEGATIDLAEFYKHTLNTRPWKGFWRRVPLAQELALEEPAALKDRYIQRCLEALRTKEQSGPLPVRLQTMYPTVLEMAGRVAEAHQRLSALEQAHPEKRKELLDVHAGLYERQGDWQNAYEALRASARDDVYPDLTVGLRTANCLLHLNLGIQALTLVERLMQIYPNSEQLKSAMGAIWDFYGFREEALFVLSHIKDLQNTPTMARLLFDTERFGEAERIAKAAGIADSLAHQRKRQGLTLPPAEWTLAWRGDTQPLNAKECDAARAPLEEGLSKAVSPYIGDLARLKIAWYAARGAQDTADAERWTAAGRDAVEQAGALNELSILLARQGRLQAARDIAARAVALCPQASMLQRILIGLSQGERETVAKARAACPVDPEIWLAHLVVKTRDDGPGAWAADELKTAIENELFSPGTVIRASDFLLRAGMTNAACDGARYAIANGRGFLPAYVTGLRCALAVKDRKWALACATSGAKSAEEPWGFYRMIVDLKSQERAMDADMIAALENLTEHYPKDAQWAQKLSDIYFLKGQTDRALSVLDNTIDRQGTEVGLETLLLAAEAARVEGKDAKALRILETAYAKYPHDLGALNNLVYQLAQDPHTLTRAREMVVQLLQLGSNSFAALDTAAVVYLRSGEVRRAEEYMNKALKLGGRNNYAWAELNLNAAEIQLALGKREQAQRSLDLIRSDAAKSAFIQTKAREVQMKIDAAAAH